MDKQNNIVFEVSYLQGASCGVAFVAISGITLFTDN